MTSVSRRSFRVQFSGGGEASLAGIIDEPQSSDVVATAVFSHCFTCGKDLKMITRLSRQLAQQGIRVLRYDMTGIGGSSGEFSQTNFTTNLADLRAAHRYVVSEYGTADVLIGHSFGGAATLAVCEELADVKGAITIAAPSDTHHLAKVLETMNPAIQSAGSGPVTIGGRSFQIDKQMLEDFRSFDLTDRLSRLSKPILAFHSPTDETVAYRHAFRIVPSQPQAEIGFPQRSLVTLPGSDHLLLNNPQDVPFVADLINVWTRRLVS